MKRILFGRNNGIPLKKIITFNRHVKDFEFFVNYGELGFLTEEEVKYVRWKKKSFTLIINSYQLLVDFLINVKQKSNSLKLNKTIRYCIFLKSCFIYIYTSNDFECSHILNFS